MKTELGITNDCDEFADSPLPFSRIGSAAVHNEMSFRTDSSSPFDECVVDPSTSDTDEGRLSRALQSWMPDHVIRPLQPREKPPPEPVFTGRLGKESANFKLTKVKYNKQGKNHVKEKRCKTAPVRRVPSNDSIVTSLSLLSCSSEELKRADTVDIVSCVQKPRKRKVASRASTRTSDEPQVSKWVELASKRGGILSRLNRSVAVRTDYGLIGGDELSGESEAFRLFDKDEQVSVYEAGRSKGIKYIDKNSLKRSDSVRGLFQTPPIQPQSQLKRPLSANANKGFGKPLDIAELKRERLNRLLAEEQARQQLERERRKGRRGAVARKISATSIVGSLVGSELSPSATAAPSVSAVSLSGHSSEHRPFSPSERGGSKSAEERVTVWKGDREILEIDLNKELTQRVKQRISTTRSALKRVTGVGDSNEHTAMVGKHDEFPKHVDEDFCHKPRIIQKMRISPHLSDVIHDDIQVRMGRPRYHEIRVSDLEQWNKGQSLDRSHRNLKVFNWLHSLRESEFKTNFEEDVPDEVPDISADLELLHVESADEPDVKPLYRAYEVRIL